MADKMRSTNVPLGFALFGLFPFASGVVFKPGQAHWGNNRIVEWAVGRSPIRQFDYSVIRLFPARQGRAKLAETVVEASLPAIGVPAHEKR